MTATISDMDDLRSREIGVRTGGFWCVGQTKSPSRTIIVDVRKSALRARYFRQSRKLMPRVEHGDCIRAREDSTGAGAETVTVVL
jgi:hypothetical protein